MSAKRSEVPSSGVSAFIGFAAQAKLTLLGSAGTSVLSALPFGFDPGDAMGTQEIGV